MHDNKKIGALLCALLMISSIDNIRNLPTTALFGSSLIFYVVFAAIVFLIPCALVAAQLSNNETGRGGIYHWVADAFGLRWGFVAVWIQWISAVVWYPTILSFIAATIAYLISPSLAQNKFYLITTIFIIFWILTFLNIKGLHVSALGASICAVIGLLIPTMIIIGIGVIWLFQDYPVQINFNFHQIIPSFNNLQGWISLTGIMASFMGMELTSVHIKNMHYPQKAYPRALLLSVLVIMTTMLLGSLTIAIILPTNQIGLNAGVMQVFKIFLDEYHLQIIFPVLVIMILLGSIGGMINWIISPAKGLLYAGTDGCLPTQFLKVNKHNVPVNILILQAILVSILCLSFLLMPSVNGSYWLLMDICVQNYILMYVLMFAAGIAMKLKTGDSATGFNIPGGVKGTAIVCGLGLVGCVISVIIGLFPPDGINVGGLWHYETIFVGGLVVMTIPAFIGCKLNKKIAGQVSSATV